MFFFCLEHVNITGPTREHKALGSTVTARLWRAVQTTKSKPPQPQSVSLSEKLSTATKREQWRHRGEHKLFGWFVMLCQKEHKYATRVKYKHSWLLSSTGCLSLVFSLSLLAAATAPTTTRANNTMSTVKNNQTHYVIVWGGGGGGRFFIIFILGKIHKEHKKQTRAASARRLEARIHYMHWIFKLFLFWLHLNCNNARWARGRRLE